MIEAVAAELVKLPLFGLVPLLTRTAQADCISIRISKNGESQIVCWTQSGLSLEGTEERRATTDEPASAPVEGRYSTGNGKDIDVLVQIYAPDIMAKDAAEHALLAQVLADAIGQSLELERDAAARERQRLGQVLHDTVVQELTAIGLHLNALSRAETGAPLAAIAGQLAAQQKQLREVLAG